MLGRNLSNDAMAIYKIIENKRDNLDKNWPLFLEGDFKIRQAERNLCDQLLAEIEKTFRQPDSTNN